MDRSVSAVGVPSSLWHNRGFLRLWIAQMISNAGTQITNVALPLTAILVLGATPAQIGLLGIASYLPNLLFGLLAGVWVDRARRRPILVGADIGRALLLGSIPVAALFGHLTFLHLYIVAFTAGILTLFFTIASLAILPSLVARHRLVEANSKLAISDSVLMIAGPGAAGGLIQLTSAPKAIIADAVSYLLSALSLGSIGASEPAPRTIHERPSIWREIGEGVRMLLGTPLLRALATSSCVGFFALAMQNTVLLLFLVRQLGLTPTVIGFVLACNGIGSLLGAGSAGWTARRIGTGPAVVLGTLLWAIGSGVVPLAGLAHIILPLICIGQVLAGIGATLYSVNQISLRQILTPVGLLGRVTAARRFVLFSTAPMGAAIGGFLGSAIGLRPTLFVGAVGFGAASLLAFFSPVRRVRDLSALAIAS